MKFKFIGSGKDDPTEIVVRGVAFEKGKAKEVPSELERFFSGHSHFEAVKRGKNKQ